MKSDIERYVESMRPEFEAKLKEWVEIPTISAEPGHRPDIERGADAAVQYLRALGADTGKVQTPGHPGVVGKFMTDKDRPVVTIYFLLDLQPATQPPWLLPSTALLNDGDRRTCR